MGPFEVGLVASGIETTQMHTELKVTIPLGRVFTNQLMKTFIPTFILSLIGYATIFIDIERPGDRLITAVTMILVQATWIAIINVDLPKTSYAKLIDDWFLWHIIYTFAIIIYHILVDRMRKQYNGNNITEVMCLTQVNHESGALVTKNRRDLVTKINRYASLVFLALK